MQKSRARRLNLPFSRAEWEFFGAILAANLALNVAAMWVEHWFIVLARGGDIPASWMEAFSLACLFGQIGILAIWAALFSGSNLLRVLLATLAVCTGSYLQSWLVQMIAPAVIEYRTWARISGLPFAVAFFYTVQTLLWILRFTYGWRIVRDESQTSQAAPRHRYTMLHVLGCMAFLSVLLGLGQVFHGRMAADAAFIIASLATVSWLYGVPYMWATLRAQRVLMALALCVLPSVAATLVGWRVYLLFYPYASAADALKAFLFVQGGAAFVGLGTGIAARLFGYRLITHARNRAAG